MSPPNRWFSAVLVGALVLRLVFCAFVVGLDREPRGDEVDYHALASHLAAGEGYLLAGGQATARRPPLYPVLLSLVYRVTGPSVAVARLLQTLLATLVVGLVYLVARRYFAERTAVVAAALAAVNPFLIFAGAYLLTENLYILLVCLFLLMIPGPGSLPARFRDVALATVMIGLAALVRPTAWLLALWVFASILVAGTGTAGGRIARTATMLLVVAAVLTPWVIRNYAVFDRWIPFTTHGGITFYQGNNRVVLETAGYYGGVAPLQALPRYDELKGMTEVAKDEAAWALGKEFLAHNKRDVPVLAARKLGRFWRLKSDVGISGIRSGWWFSRNTTLGRLAASVDVGFVYALFVFPLFAVGVIATRRDYRRLLFPYGMIVVHTLSAVVFFGSIRMRIPIEPLIAIFAAHGACLLAPRLLHRLRRI